MDEFCINCYETITKEPIVIEVEFEFGNVKRFLCSEECKEEYLAPVKIDDNVEAGK